MGLMTWRVAETSLLSARRSRRNYDVTFEGKWGSVGDGTSFNRKSNLRTVMCKAECFPLEC